MYLTAAVASLLFLFTVSSLGPNRTQSLISMASKEPLHVSRDQLPQPSPGAPTYLQTDYAEGVEDVYLMVKTGATVLWKRLPVHFLTTFKQVPYFQVYSDMAETISDHHVIDTFENVSEALKLVDDFELYRIQQEMINSHSNMLIEDNPGITSNRKGWSLDKYKNLPMLQHAWSVRPDAKWFVFMDADSYVMWTPLMNWLSTLNHRHALYMGSSVGRPPVQFAHGGSVVIISRGAMLRSFGRDSQYFRKYEKKTIKTCCGDLMVAHALYDSGVKIAIGENQYPYAKWKFQGEPNWLVYGNKDNWCAPIMSFHHVSMQNIQDIWEFEQDWKKTHHKDEYIRYVDVYHRFMHPYLEAQKDEWDNRSNDREYSNAEDRPKASREPAFESLETCIEYCEAWDECVGYRFNPGFCGLSRSVRLGRRRGRYGDEKVDESKRWISGWMLDRIRDMRAHSGCDSIANEEILQSNVTEDSLIVPGLEVKGKGDKKGLFGF